MANSRTNELDENFFGDDEELDESDDREETAEEDFSYSNLSASEKKRYDKMKAEIEGAIVSEIARGDTNSEVYKGLQRVLARKDKELAEARNALAGVIDKVNNDKSGQKVDFLENILRDLLDDDGRKEYDNRLRSFNTEVENQKNKQILDQLLKGQAQVSVPMYGQPSEEDAQIAQYRKEATQKLKSFAKRMGVDPDSSGLDYGSEDEPLLVRMDKLSLSIEKVSEENDLDKVRRKVPQPKTRTNGEPVKETGNGYAMSLLERGVAQMIKQTKDANKR